MKASSHFSAKFMSDAKWRKFFEIAAENAEAVFAATWKLIDESQPMPGNLPRVEDIMDTAVDGCLNGPVEYKNIEWIEVPRNVNFKRYPNAPLDSRSQDLAGFKCALDAEAKFPLEETLDGLRLRAYQR